MTNYLVKRVIMMVITLFMIALLTFVLMHVVPGGPFTLKTGALRYSKGGLNASIN